MQYDECNDEKLYLHPQRAYLSGVQKKGEGEEGIENKRYEGMYRLFIMTDF